MTASEKPRREKVTATSAAPLEEALAKLRDLLPAIFSEGKIDEEKLRTILGESLDARAERFSFTWAGKRDALRMLQVPSRATLVPAPEESINFDSATNVFIEGENLEVLKLLYKSYFGRVKMIYIDPPYNTGGDFVYPDNFADPLGYYLELTGQRDTNGALLTSNTETGGRFHSNWLTMIYPRLFVARQLLRDDGVIFVSIDDTEIHNLRQVMNEVFGEENFVATVVWKRKRGRDNSAKWFSKSHEYLLVYAKDIANLETNLLDLDEETIRAYKNPDNDPRGAYRLLGVWARGTQGGVRYDFTSKSGQYFAERLWLLGKPKLVALDDEDKLVFHGDKVYRKLFITENRGKIPETIWDATSNAANAADEIKSIFGAIVFDTPKPIPYIREMLRIATSKDDLILDFFAGSGSTAHAVMVQNEADGGTRRWICIQLPERVSEESKAHRLGHTTIADIGKERIRRVVSKLAKEKRGRLDLSGGTDDMANGMRVYKLSPSNLKLWNGVAGQEPQDYIEQMKLHTDPIVDGSEPESVVWEIALKEGFSLTSRVTRRTEGNNAFWQINDDRGRGAFWICLDDEVTKEAVGKLNLTSTDLFVCRDSALTDTVAANLALQCQLKTI